MEGNFFTIAFINASVEAKKDFIQRYIRLERGLRLIARGDDDGIGDAGNDDDDNDDHDNDEGNRIPLTLQQLIIMHNWCRSQGTHFNTPDFYEAYKLHLFKRVLAEEIRQRDPTVEV